MKKIVTYECEFCGKSFKNSQECLVHECQHIKISIDVYEEWCNLKKEILRATTILHYDGTHSEEAEKAFNKAIEDLLNFEKEHNISERDIKKVGL